MEDYIAQILGLGMAMSPIVILLVETVKAPGIIASRWLTWVSVIIGIGFGLALAVMEPSLGSLAELALSGLVAGTVASGIYNQVSNKNVTSGVITEPSVHSPLVENTVDLPDYEIKSTNSEEESN